MRFKVRDEFVCETTEIQGKGSSYLKGKVLAISQNPENVIPTELKLITQGMVWSKMISHNMMIEFLYPTMNKVNKEKLPVFEPMSQMLESWSAKETAKVVLYSVLNTKVLTCFKLFKINQGAHEQGN